MLPKEIIDAMLEGIDVTDPMNGHLINIVKNSVEAGYAAGCEAAASIVDVKSVPLGSERRYFAKAIRQFYTDLLG